MSESHVITNLGLIQCLYPYFLISPASYACFVPSSVFFFIHMLKFLALSVNWNILFRLDLNCSVFLCKIETKIPSIYISSILCFLVKLKPSMSCKLRSWTKPFYKAGSVTIVTFVIIIDLSVISQVSKACRMEHFINFTVDSPRILYFA